MPYCHQNPSWAVEICGKEPCKGVVCTNKSYKVRKRKNFLEKYIQDWNGTAWLCLPGLEIPAPSFIDGISWSSACATQVMPSQTSPSPWVLLFPEVLINSFDRCWHRGGDLAAKHFCGCSQTWILFQNSQNPSGKSHSMAAATESKNPGVKGLLEGISSCPKAVSTSLLTQPGLF